MRSDSDRDEIYLRQHALTTFNPHLDNAPYTRRIDNTISPILTNDNEGCASLVGSEYGFLA